MVGCLLICLVFLIGTIFSFRAKTTMASSAYNSYLFGIINNAGAHYTDEWKRGVRATVLELSWKAYEPQEGIFDTGYISRMQQTMRMLKSQGWFVQLGTGIQYTPSWVFSHYTNMRFVNQYGDAYSPDPTTQGDHDVINAPFNPQARALQAAYIARIFQDFNQSDLNLHFNSIRIGGGVQGELRYPPSAWNGHTNSYWAYDAYAQNASISGISPNLIGWRPGIDPNPGTTGRGQLIVNPGFETSDAYFPILGWTPDDGISAFVTSNQPHSGSRALQLDISSPGRIHQYVRVSPNTTYILNGWVKSTNGSAIARIFISQYLAQAKPLPDTPLKLESTSTTWSLLTTTITTGATAQYLKVELDGSQAGTYYFDDLSLMRGGETNIQNRDLNTPIGFLNWYVKSMTDYQNWQINQFRKYYSGQLDLLYAGKGVLPNLVMDALTNDLHGDGWGEGNSGLYAAALYDRHVAGLSTTNNIALYITGFEDMPPSAVNDASPYPSDWSSARWIAYLARTRNLGVWGENSGEDTYSGMQLAVQRMQENGFIGLMWVFETELYANSPAYANIDQYAGLINKYTSLNNNVFLPFMQNKK
jgi:hypothetical protein